MSLWHRVSQALTRTRERFLQAVRETLGQPDSSDAVFQAIEEGLLQSDVGVEITEELLQHLRRTGRKGSIELLAALRDALLSYLPEPPPEQFPSQPTVVLVVGVNGFGKTTTVAKLAYRWKQQGKQVLIAAADTFRAAAIEQLQQWAEALGVGYIRHRYGADPAAVAYDAVQAARARGVDVVLIDTAGRLHTKTPLMAELEKMVRVLRKVEPTAPHEVLLVLDASVGQNALAQTQEFLRHLPITGVVLTKVDGSARGGMALAVARKCRVPIRYLGVGEGIEDLLAFEPVAFVQGLVDTLSPEGALR